MKKTIMIAFMALALTTFTACGNEDNNTADELETEEGMGTDANVEVDSSVTLDPDTTIEHEMAL